MRLWASWSPRSFRRRDRRQPVLRRSGVAGGEDRRLGKPQRRCDARIAFLGELRLQRRQRLCVMGLEHVRGRGKPLLGIGIGEGQRSHRALDRASKRVVDAHLLEGRGVDAFNRRASLGVEDRAGGGLIGDEAIAGIDQQAIVAERLQNGRAPEAAPRRPARRSPPRFAGICRRETSPACRRAASARAAVANASRARTPSARNPKRRAKS